jgi:hypothetical protein
MIIIGIILTVIGALFVIKTEWFLQNFGSIEFFDKNLGSSGGSRLGWKLLGLISIVIGILMMTGSGGQFWGWVLSPLIKTQNPNI